LANQNSSDPDITHIVLTGAEDITVPQTRIKYGEISRELQESVLQNTQKLLSLVLDNEELNLKNYFGIDTDLDVVKRTLEQHLKDGLQEGLSAFVNNKEPLEESLFFYPFVHSLVNLSKELNHAYYV
jgi:hypothetical protein